MGRFSAGLVLAITLLALGIPPRSSTVRAAPASQSSTNQVCDASGLGLCLEADQTQVLPGTTVMLTATVGYTLATSGATDLLISDTGTPAPGNYLTDCSLPTVNQCTTTVSMSTDGSQQYYGYVVNGTTLVAQTPPLTITWGTGGGGPCGQTLGQHCNAVWTDRSSYNAGDTITLCFSVAQASHVTITETFPNGQSQVAYDNDDDGTGGCFTGTAADPPGTRQVTMGVYVLGSAPGAGSQIGSAQTSFTVVDTSPPTPVPGITPFPTPAPPTATPQPQYPTATPTPPIPTSTPAQPTPTPAQPTPTPAPPTPTPKPVSQQLPGGVWLSPGNDFVVESGHALHFGARAYPVGNGAPGIVAVKFTASWKHSKNSAARWSIICDLTRPTYQDQYWCTWNLVKANVPMGSLQVSFDVYDAAGRHHLAPNGVHRGVVRYSTERSRIDQEMADLNDALQTIGLAAAERVRVLRPIAELIDRATLPLDLLDFATGLKQAVTTVQQVPAHRVPIAQAKKRYGTNSRQYHDALAKFQSCFFQNIPWWMQQLIYPFWPQMAE